MRLVTFYSNVVCKALKTKRRLTFWALKDNDVNLIREWVMNQ